MAALASVTAGRAGLTVARVSAAADEVAVAAAVMVFNGAVDVSAGAAVNGGGLTDVAAVPLLLPLLPLPSSVESTEENDMRRR